MESTTETVHIGRLIKHQLSLRPEMTIKIFADKLGVHEQTVYDIYRREDINTEQLKRIAEILDLPITYFFFPDDTPDTDFAANSNGNVLGSSPANPEPEAQNTAAKQKAPSIENPESYRSPVSAPKTAPQPAPNGSANATARPAENALLQQQLKWANEKIALLEARIADKDEMIDLLKSRQAQF